ncbi:YagK/YfjJ domain-containing protein [Bordetella ansorpii]|uniref:YagK/YfjJ domain-containing protein n=1 Tax=Bordetella ansorpii TaxID=288768 RepID=UPI00138FA9A0|nr:inovirus-type Gp2 protein [Bordetella ansorpii]
MLETDDTLKFFGSNEDLATAVDRVVEVAKLALSSECRFFSLDVASPSVSSHLGGCRKIAQAVQTYLPRLRKALPRYRENPYIALVDDAFAKGGRAERAAHRWLSKKEMSSRATSEILAKRINRAIREMRTKSMDAVFQRDLKDFTRSSAKNKRELDRYVDAIFEKRARLLVVRVDLTYRKRVDDPGAIERRLQMSLVKNDWSKMYSALQNDLSEIELEGFAYKIEYGPEKKFHIHIMLLLDGSKVRKDVLIARKVGECWQRIVPDGQGLYFNCNAKKYKYAALGPIDWSDEKKREILSEFVVSYLTKPDMYLPLVMNGERRFGKGNTPRKVSQRGRRRAGLES